MCLCYLRKKRKAGRGRKGKFKLEGEEGWEEGWGRMWSRVGGRVSWKVE
jgi:hypothetical protein